MEELFQKLMEAVPWLVYVISGLGTLVVLAQTYIAITPSQKDDKWYAKLEEKALIGSLLKLLVKFAPIQRKRDEAKERSSDK